jgi:hypothetical protein
MSTGFWVFECTFVVNNNLLMGEVFAGATRAEMIAAMKRFFAASRAHVVLAEVLGAYYVEAGKAEAFHDAHGVRPHALMGASGLLFAGSYSGPRDFGLGPLAP